MLEAFDLPFAQRGFAELLALSVGAGLLGTWIVARGLAFFAHAVGTATFPGLVLAEGLGFAAPLGALAAALLFAIGVGRRSARQGRSTDALTAITLVASLALGIVLASDVFGSGAGVDTLLFGSVLLIGWDDVALAAGASALVLGASLLIGRTWLAQGFDAEAARALGQRSPAPDALLLGLVALIAVASLAALGALLTTALLIVPAATTRLWTDRMLPWQLSTVVLTAALGVLGIMASVETNAPPGATIAVLAGAAFALSAVARGLSGRRSLAAVAVAGAVLIVAGCGSGGAGGGAGADKPKIVATTPIVADWVRQVGGDDVEVVQLLQPNSDPHDYEPRPDDVRALAGAKLVIANGGELDEWIGEAVKESGSAAKVVNLLDTAPVKREGGHHEHEEEHAGKEEEHAGKEEKHAGEEEEHAGKEEEHAGEEEEHAGEEIDAHFFHDPRNAQAAVGEIEKALVEVDQAGAATFAANADRYDARLKALDRKIAGCLSGVPEEQRKLVTDHDAFGYFADRYGIEVVGAVIPALTTQAQPSAGEVAELADTIEKEKVRAVFPEESVNQKLARQIADRTGASADNALYGDTLGPRGSSGDTYLRMQAANANAMASGFTGGARGCPS